MQELKKIYLTNMNKIKEDDRKLLSTALTALYELEEKTDYKNKNISKAINLLQKEV